MSSPSSSARFISDGHVRPRQVTEDSKKLISLPPWDLFLLSSHYIQKGLLFLKPPEAYTQADFMESLLSKLKDSLSLALVHFYPLAGRLKTMKNDDLQHYTIYVDCENSPGVRFIHATLDVTVSDIMSPVYVPQFVNTFFDHDGAVSHDGHTMSLVSIQVTELIDGIFIGCSFNHTIGDGTSFWHFFNAWSDIFRAQEKGVYHNTISRPPILQRWFPGGCDRPINLPFHDPSEFIFPLVCPILKARVFHFSSETITQLKARANKECGTEGKAAAISSFKSLAGLVWRSITRARRLNPNQITSCRMVADIRPRMSPPLPREYFGNCVTAVNALTTTSELLHGGLGQAASLFHEAVAKLTVEEINERYQEWLRKPTIHNFNKLDSSCVMIGSSPRFDVYGNEFGLGKSVVVRSGNASKFDGRVWAYPGCEGGGSVDLEICLVPETMATLESDDEFMAAVSV